MTTISQVNDDYIQLQVATNEMNELIKKTRAEFNLLPIFKAKRRITEITEPEESEPMSKKVRFVVEEPEKKVNNRHELMTRLSSFSFLYHYFARPLTALECAKHGWKDTKNVLEKDPNICALTCEDCKNKMFVIDVDLKTCDQKKAIDISKKYQAGLYDCHKEDCIWRHEKCEDSVYHFPLFSISEGLDRFKNEAEKIIACSKEKLPDIEHDLNDKMLSKVQYFAKEENQTTAYLFSLYGWKSLDENIPGIQCDLCFERKAFYQLEKEEKFDVLNQHKLYCPWINSTTANAYTPREFSNIKNQKIDGINWMKEIINIEYNILIRKKDLSLASAFASDEKYHALKHKMQQSYNLLNNWKSTIEKLETSDL